MRSFKSFLTESDESKKLKHITHAEDRPLQKGSEGFQHAVGALQQAHEHIKSGGHSTHLTMKYEGSPSIVFGHHPKTGKFFVASKSAFNVNPKINYSEKDIEKNHGHAPGLVEKLKQALHHLPKVAPKKGVYQGDVMFGEHDKKEHKGGVSFTPNTITYTAKGEKAKKIKDSKLGVIVHTQYHGKDIQHMSADPHPDVHNFTHHPDVWHKSANHDTKQVHYSEDDQKEVEKHLKAAKDIHDKHGKMMYLMTQPHHGEKLESYINQTVRNDTKPNTEDFKKHIALLAIRSGSQKEHKPEGGTPSYVKAYLLRKKKMSQRQSRVDNLKKIVVIERILQKIVRSH